MTNIITYKKDRDIWDGTIENKQISEYIEGTTDTYVQQYGVDKWDTIGVSGFDWNGISFVDATDDCSLVATGTWTSFYRPLSLKITFNRNGNEAPISIDVKDISDSTIGSGQLSDDVISELDTVVINLSFGNSNISSININFGTPNNGNGIDFIDISFLEEGTGSQYIMWDGVIPTSMFQEHLYQSYYGEIDISSLTKDENNFVYLDVQEGSGTFQYYIDKNRNFVEDEYGNRIQVGEVLVFNGNVITDEYRNVYLNTSITYDLVEDADPEFDPYFGFRVNIDGEYIDSFNDPILDDDDNTITNSDLLLDDFGNVVTDISGDVYLKSSTRVKLFKLDNYGAGISWYDKFDYQNYPIDKFPVGTKGHPSYDGTTFDVLSTNYRVDLDISIQPYSENDVVPESISQNLYNLWEIVRPISRNPDYNLVLGQEVDITGSVFSTYSGVYSQHILTNAAISAQPEEGAAIFINTDTVTDSWTVRHGLGKNIVVKCFNENFEQLVPDYIKLLNDVVFIKFKTNVRGFALIKEAQKYSKGLLDGTNWDLLHLTGKKYTIAQFFDSSDIMWYPDFIKAPNPNDPNDVNILTTNAPNGYGTYVKDVKEILITTNDVFVSDDLLPETEKEYPYWIVKHDYNVLGVIVDCYDSNGNYITPYKVTFENPNEVRVTFNFDEFAGDGSTAVVTPIGDIGSIEGPIQRNPDGTLYQYDWRLGFTTDTEDRRILSDDRYTDVDEEGNSINTGKSVLFLDTTYTGKVESVDEDDNWAYYTVRIPKEGSINITEIGLFSDKISIEERQNVFYTKCKPIFKPDGMSMYVYYRVYKDPAGLGAITEFLIDSNEEYVLDNFDQRIETIREISNA